MPVKNKKINVRTTKKKLTSFAGLAAFANAIENNGIKNKLEIVFSDVKKRNRGYEVSDKINSLLLLMLSGGEYLSDIGRLNSDEGFKELMGIKTFPVKSVLSDFLNLRTNDDIGKYQIMNMEYAIEYYKANKIKNITLDIDSVLSENSKAISAWSYKNFKAFNPMLLVDEENHIVLCGIFRNGNASPQTEILEVFNMAFKYLKLMRDEGIIEKITVRIDSAGYQKDIIDYFNENIIYYTITGDSSANRIELFKKIPENEWKKYDEIYSIARTQDFISSNGKETAVNIIVKRRLKKDPDLFGIYDYYYFVYKSEGLMEAEELTVFHAHRANAENIFKEMKADFWLDNFPCNTLNGNAFFMQIMIHAYNLFQMLKKKLFNEKWASATLRTMQYHFIHLAGYVVKSGRRIFLTVNERFKNLKDFIILIDTSQYQLLNAG